MKDTYRKIGMGLLIAEIAIFLLSNFSIILALSSWSFFYPHIVQTFSAFSMYERVAMIGLYAIEMLLWLWGIMIAILLAKTNRYTRQLLYWIFAWAMVKIFDFVLYIPTKRYLVVELGIGVLIYYFLIHSNNKWSRLVKGQL